MLTIVHIVNQFFAGLGGEEKAGSPVEVLEGAAGAARGLQAQLGDRGKVVATIYYGDNYFHEHVEEAKGVIVREVEKRRPDVVVAGPAFNSGRYGLASVEICQAVAEDLGIGCVVGMDAENPAVPAYREYRNMRVYLLPTAESAAGMTKALSVMAQFACRVGSGAEIGSAAEEGYLPRGIRRLGRTDRPGAERASGILLRKVGGKPFVTEGPMEVWDQVAPAAPLAGRWWATVA